MNRAKWKNTRVEEKDVNHVSDPEDSIIDETLKISTVKDRTRSKSKKYNILQAICDSDSEHEIFRPPHRKRAQRGSGAVPAGVTSNSYAETRTNSQVLAARIFRPEGTG